MSLRSNNETRMGTWDEPIQGVRVIQLLLLVKSFKMLVLFDECSFLGLFRPVQGICAFLISFVILLSWAATREPGFGFMGPIRSYMLSIGVQLLGAAISAGMLFSKFCRRTGDIRISPFKIQRFQVLDVTIFPVAVRGFPALVLHEG